MATDASRSRYQVLGLEIPTVAFDTTNSTYTEYGPRPGVPAAQQDTQMVLETSGSQSASQDIRIQTLRGGLPGLEQAQWVRQNNGDTDWYGCDVPNAIQQFEAVDWDTTSDGNRHMYGVTLRNQKTSSYNGRMVVAYDFVSGANAKVGTRYYTTSWTSEVSPYSETQTAGGDYLHPCLVEMPDGDLMLFCMTYDDANSQGQLHVEVSTDGGATFTETVTAALDTVIDISSLTVKRVRAAYANGTVLLMIWAQEGGATTHDWVFQYASRDGGNTFKLVATFDSTLGGYPDVVVAGGQFRVFVVGGEGTLTAGKPYMASLANAYRALSVSDFAEVTNGGTTLSEAIGAQGSNALTDGEMAVVVTDAGDLYVYLRYSPAAVSDAGCIVMRSIDNGESWTAVGSGNVTGSSDGLGTWWRNGSTAEYPLDFSACWHKGRVVIHTNCASTGGTADRSWFALYLGGYSTVTMPKLDKFQLATRQVGWVDNYLPIDVPDNMGWTNGNTGSPTVSVTSGYLSISCGAGDTSAYTQNALSGTTTEGLEVLFDAQAVSGTGKLNVRVADGSVDYEVQLQFTASALTAVDRATAGVLATSLSATGRLEVRVELSDSALTVFWRSQSTTPNREWNTLYTSTLTNGTTGAIRVQFATDASSEWRIYGCHFAHDEYTGQGPWASDITNPDDLIGRPFVPTPVYIDDGVMLTAKGGPTVAGDEWSIATRYDRPVANLLTASPQEYWEATGVATTDLVFEIDDTDDAAIGSDLLIVGLMNINFSSVQVAGYDGSYTSIFSGSTATGLSSLRWERLGTTIRPSSTAAIVEPFVHMNEFAGAEFALALGSSGVGRKISRHTEGKWTDDTTKKPTFYMDGITGSEGTSGTSGQITPKNAVFAIPLNGARYRRIRIRILTPTAGEHYPADGRWRCGRVFLGHGFVFGEDYSWGRRLNVDDPSALDDLEDGTTRSRVKRDPRRTYEFGWVDGVDLSAVQSTDGYGDPNYLNNSTTGSAEPVGVERAIAPDLDGLVSYQQGSSRLLMAIWNLTKSNNSQVFNRRNEFAYGRQLGGIDIENVQGRELEDEVVRIPRMLIREEL